jgi:hypothetical protein
LLLSAALFLIWTPFPEEAVQVRAVRANPAVDSSVVPAKDAASALPDAPEPKAASSADSEAVSPAGPPFANSAMKLAVTRTPESPRQRKAWYALLVAGHSAAVFDAWSTRRGVSGGYGTEGDPLLRPFSHSSAIYAATQVSPAVMDYLGHRMLTSNNAVFHRFWWVPQVAGASFSFGAGMHNYRLAH